MPLKVLCLHGFRQNSTSFRSKSGGFRKLFKNNVQFVFIDAPHLVPKGEQNPNEDTNSKSWWFSEKPLIFYSKKPSDICIGFDESVKAISEACVNQGPFDGIMGFSQGAAMSVLICAMIRDGLFEHKFKFAIFVAAFESLNSEHEKYYSKQLDIPSLHIIGETDNVIEKERSESLVKLFSNAKVWYHNGGHYMPSTSKLRNDLNEFLNPFLET